MGPHSESPGPEGDTYPNKLDRQMLKVIPRDHTTTGGPREAQENQIAQLATGQGWVRVRGTSCSKRDPEGGLKWARPASGLIRRWTQSLAAQSTGIRLTAPASSGSLLETQSLWFHLYQKNQNLHCNKRPGDLCACSSSRSSNLVNSENNSKH